jgi:hypothetical protein
MNLTNSWTNLFIAIRNSDEANKNMAFFSNAMKPDQTNSEKIIALVNKDDTVRLVIGNTGQIKILHSFKKFVGTRTRPTLKVGCLFGNEVEGIDIICSSHNTSSVHWHHYCDCHKTNHN